MSNHVDVSYVTQQTTQPVHWRVIAAAVAGNAFEVYDFAIFAYFAVFIGQIFFPLSGEYSSLLAATATFGVGFFTRPLGALLIGSYADRVGRKPAMILTVVLITLGTVGIAVTPGYAVIGIAAPIIVITCRLIQGLALGGEIGPATALLIESAPPEKRARYACWQLASQGIALVFGGLFGVVISLSMSPESLAAWGWRLPFIFSLLMVPLALYIRRNVPETLQPPKEKHNLKGILQILWRHHRRILFIGLGIMLVINVTSQLGNYMASYAIKTLHLPPVVAQSSIMMAGLMTFICALIAGWCCDKYGRKIVLSTSVGVLCVAIFPLFYWLSTHPDGTHLLILTLVLASLIAFTATASLVVVPELLPAEFRSTGISLVYAFSSALFGGTTHVIVTGLLAWTRDPVSPAMYVVVAGVISLIAISFLSGNRKVLPAH